MSGGAVAMSLPPLHQLQLAPKGVAIGAPRLQGVASTTTPRPEIALIKKVNPGKPLLEEIYTRLSTGTLPEGSTGAGDVTLLTKWKDACIKSMGAKAALYGDKAKAQGKQVEQEEKRILAYTLEARRKFGNQTAKNDINFGVDRQKGEREQPKRGAKQDAKKAKAADGSAASSSGTVSSGASDSEADAPKVDLRHESQTRDPHPQVWDVAEKINDTWQTLVYGRTAFEVIKEAAASRSAEMSDRNTWVQKGGELAKAIKELYEDFEGQTTLLESMSELIMAFIEYPMVTQNSMVNMVLMGNAGTGKTRLAEKIAAVMGKLGMFVFEDFAVAGRGDFVAEYEGQTAPKTRRFLMSNLERVVFLDEAYSLTQIDDNGKPNPVSAEAVAEIIKILSDWPGSTCLIAAGYEYEMQNEFLPFNPGMSRRFLIKIALADYTVTELETIYLKSLARAMEGGQIASPTKEVARNFFKPEALQFFKNCLWKIKYSKTWKDQGSMFGWQLVPDYPHLAEFVDAQAGAMVTMANVTAQKIASGDAAGLPGQNWYITPNDVYYIFQQVLENQRGDKAKEDMKKELDPITIAQGITDPSSATAWAGMPAAGTAWYTEVAPKDDDEKAYPHPEGYEPVTKEGKEEVSKEVNKKVVDAIVKVIQAAGSATAKTSTAQDRANAMLAGLGV